MCPNMASVHKVIAVEGNTLHLNILQIFLFSFLYYLADKI